MFRKFTANKLSGFLFSSVPKGPKQGKNHVQVQPAITKTELESHIKPEENKTSDVPLIKIIPHPNFAAAKNLVHPLKEVHHEVHHDEHHHDEHHGDHGHHDPHPRDTYKKEVVINAYNSLMKQLRNDIHMQNQVYQALEKMDRPYLNGVKGDQQSAKQLVSYSNPQDLGFPVKDMEWENDYLEKMMDNKDRWIFNTPFYQKYDKMSHEIQHEKDLLNRPVNDHFHADKGSMYDVRVPQEEKHPFLADRLGHPEILGTPFERLLRLESDIYHPACLDQPFIQLPKADPVADLNFEEGDIIYENSQIQEWAKFWKLTGLGVYSWFFLFVPYQLILKTHMPLQDSYNNIFMNYYTHSYYNFDNNEIHIPAVAGCLMYSSYYFFKASDRAFKDYVVKLQYSKDKELLFVTRVSPYGAQEEEVYEMAHLEMLPPSVKSSLPFLSAQDDDGLWDVSCLNTQTNLVVSGEDKFWAPGHRKDFFNRVTGLWQEYASPVKSGITLSK